MSIPALKLTLAGALCAATVAFAHEPATPAQPGLLNTETTDLPQGRVKLSANERVHPPGARTPWHTSGPKFIHMLQGQLTAYGLDGQVLHTCEAPKVCFFSPREQLWFFRNTGSAPMKIVLISVDAPERPTIHETVGQVTRLSGRQVTLAVGDVRTSGLAQPAQELTLQAQELPADLAVGDRVVTVRHDEARQQVRTVVRLRTAWQ